MPSQASDGEHPADAGGDRRVGRREIGSAGKRHGVAGTGYTRSRRIFTNSQADRSLGSRETFALGGAQRRPVLPIAHVLGVCLLNRLMAQALAMGPSGADQSFFDDRCGAQARG